MKKKWFTKSSNFMSNWSYRFAFALALVGVVSLFSSTTITVASASMIDQTTPYAWYRADMGVVTNDGSTVIAWEDQSGNGRDLTASGTPVIGVSTSENGKDVITFDGNDKFEGTAASWGTAAPGTIFAVVRRSQPYDCYIYDSYRDDAERQFFDIKTSDGYDKIVAGGDHWEGGWNSHYTAIQTAYDGVGDMYLTTLSCTGNSDGTDDVIRVNGYDLYTGNLQSGGMTGLRLGANMSNGRWLYGDIAEVIIYEGELTSAEILAIEDELSNRWLVTEVPGDANGDGKVDGSDVTILAGNWQKGVSDGLTATWEEGDFNGDGKVDGSDVTILAGNWQHGVEAAASAVPEPSTIVLLLCGIATVLFLRRYY